MQFPFFIFLLSSLIFVFLCCVPTVRSVVVVKNITVDLYGHGNYKSVQAAINSIPDYNNQWIRIYVKQGIYTEKVVISNTKPYILLEGDGPMRSLIQWGDHAPAFDWTNNTSNVLPLDTESSATFTVSASNFVGRNIGFKNTYNNMGSFVQAVAALVGGDKIKFDRCGFFGYQDTLCDYVGRHSFSQCWIEGNVDFIFGFGQSIYDHTILKVKSTVGGAPVWVTANGRDRPDSPSGFVFKYCTVTGTGKAFLGRAWREYSRVVFYRSHMTDVVVPPGWDPWLAAGHEGLTTYAESGCYGPGSNKSKRVKWEKELTGPELDALVRITFIDKEGWLLQQP